MNSETRGQSSDLEIGRWGKACKSCWFCRSWAKTGLTIWRQRPLMTVLRSWNEPGTTVFLIVLSQWYFCNGHFMMDTFVFRTVSAFKELRFLETWRNISAFYYFVLLWLCQCKIFQLTNWTCICTRHLYQGFYRVFSAAIATTLLASASSISNNCFLKCYGLPRTRGKNRHSSW